MKSTSSPAKHSEELTERLRSERSAEVSSAAEQLPASKWSAEMTSAVGSRSVLLELAQTVWLGPRGGVRAYWPWVDSRRRSACEGDRGD